MKIKLFIGFFESFGFIFRCDINAIISSADIAFQFYIIIQNIISFNFIFSGLQRSYFIRLHYSGLTPRSYCRDKLPFFLLRAETVQRLTLFFVVTRRVINTAFYFRVVGLRQYHDLCTYFGSVLSVRCHVLACKAFAFMLLCSLPLISFGIPTPFGVSS
jgi:hypothetical protein